MTLHSALADGTAFLHRLPTARRDAELLLLNVTGHDRAFLLTHPDAELAREQLTTYEGWIARRARHEPVQYIIGEQEFYGLALRVTPDVLIPRPETEHLVEALLERVAHDASLRIADVGTGSGAIAIAIAHTLPLVNIIALDCSLPALAVARQNAERHNVAERIRFLESNLLAVVASEKFDAVVSNPPYVPDGEVLEAQVHDYEPVSALYAGTSGLDIYRRLIPQARDVLEPGGWLMMEFGHGQRDALAGLLTGWDGVEFVDDLQGIPRVAVARRG
jgi:release factor glutamine methyltransferase